MKTLSLGLAAAIDLIGAEDAVVDELGAYLGGIGPRDVGPETTFDELGMDDVEINDFAEQVAQRLRRNLRMPVSCATLGDLALECAKAELRQ